METEVSLLYYIIAVIGGFFAGVVNTLAGSGSAITLTILTELLGLPGNIANGTNRIGVFTQSAASTYAFHKNDKLHISKSWMFIFPTIVGAIVGVIVAVYVSNEQFIQVFRYLMIVLFFVILVKPKRWLRETDTSQPPNLWLTIPVFVILGFYGGFIQMGMGVFFLAAMVLGAKYSLLDGNVIKSFVVFAYTLLAILIFQWQGLIDWKMGAILAIGQTAGGYLTAQFASRSPQANIWAHRLLVAVILLAILKLFNIL